MANKLVVVFLMCIVVAAALQFQQADAETENDKKVYKSCFKKCMTDCDTKGKQYTLCETKCDEDCIDKENDEKLYEFDRAHPGHHVNVGGTYGVESSN